jgi:ribonuclease D
MTTLASPILVTEANQLEEVAAALLKEPLVSVDTESNSLYAYREQVCLIQFSIPEADYLVDPLALKDLSALHELFSSPDTEKIFHAAEYDLLTMKRDFGYVFNNIFDTMQSARILGHPKVGLGNLLSKFFNVQLEKRFQRADWGKRPLPQNMLDYARMDTHLLIKMRNKLKTDLEEKGRWPIAAEDFTRLAWAEGTPPGPVEINIWRVNGANNLSPRDAAILQFLVVGRDKKAEKYNQPPFKILGDKVLYAIVETQPHSQSELNSIPNLSPRNIQRHGKWLLKAVEDGMDAPPVYRPKRTRYPAGYSDRLEALRQWRKHTAQPLRFESDVVLPRDVMLALARESTMNPKTLGEIMESVPWRLNQSGDQILAVFEEIT